MMIDLAFEGKALPAARSRLNPVQLTHQGQSPLVFYEGRLNSAKYIDILSEHLSTTAIHMNLRSFCLVHDPHSAHKSKKLLNYYENNRINSLIIPGNRQDFVNLALI
jgi:hypothetical protein